MVFHSREQTVVRMYMNHSLSGIEDSVSELDSDFKNWIAHPVQRGAWKRVAEHLISLRWLLEQHFSKLAGEGLLENVAYRHPNLYPELRSIEIWQDRVLDDLDKIIRLVETLELPLDQLDGVAVRFRYLKHEILDVESMELAFLEHQSLTH